MEKPKEAIDPVCRMTVDIDTAEFRSQHDGVTYYFCSGRCKTLFDREPDRYAAHVSDVSAG